MSMDSRISWSAFLYDLHVFTRIIPYLFPSEELDNRYDRVGKTTRAGLLDAYVRKADS